MNGRENGIGHNYLYLDLKWYVYDIFDQSIIKIYLEITVAYYNIKTSTLTLMKEINIAY